MTQKQIYRSVNKFFKGTVNDISNDLQIKKRGIFDPQEYTSKEWRLKMKIKNEWDFNVFNFENW